MARFSEELLRSESLREVVREYQQAATALPLSLPPVDPSPGLRARVLATATEGRPPKPAVFTWFFWSAAALCLVSLALWALVRPTGPGQDMRFVATAAAPDARGHAACKGASVEILVCGLPALPAGKVYQLWQLGAGPAPVPMRTFRLDAAGDLRGWDRLHQAIERGQGFAITQEPAAGSLQPTLPIYARTAQ